VDARARFLTGLQDKHGFLSVIVVGKERGA
jgi:hypothetical protein